MAGKIKNVSKNHTAVICSIPQGARKGSWCRLAVLPLQLGGMEITIIPSCSSCRDKGAPLPGWEPLSSPLPWPLVQADKFSQREPFVLTYSCGEEQKLIRLSVLIKSRGHLRRNKLSKRGTSKGKCVVRKFTDFSICKAEACSLFMFVLRLTLFMGHFKNPQELPQIWDNTCTNCSKAFEFMGYGAASGVKGPAARLVYSNLATLHTALRAALHFFSELSLPT